MKIVIGSDHAGYTFKQKIIEYLHQKHFVVEDIGCANNEKCNYPDFAHKVAGMVNREPNCRGLLVCTTGQGMSMTANKYPNVRAALCWDKEIARLSRAHNNANVLCVPAAYISNRKVHQIIDAFFSTQFEGGRHLERVNKIPEVQI